MGILGGLPARPPNPGLKDMGRRATGAPDHVLPLLLVADRRAGGPRSQCTDVAFLFRGAYDLQR
jgi:hypothetical protein